MKARTLHLRREVLAELPADELRRVLAAAAPDVERPGVAAHVAEPAHTVRCAIAGCSCYCS